VWERYPFPVIQFSVYPSSSAFDALLRFSASKHGKKLPKEIRSGQTGIRFAAKITAVCMT
jgi:hypothetical protein